MGHLSASNQSNNENSVVDEEALFYVKCQENPNISLGIKELEGYKYFIDEYGTQKYSKDGVEIIFTLHLSSEFDEGPFEYNLDWGHFYSTKNIMLTNAEGDSINCIECVNDFPDGNSSKSYELFRKIDNDYTVDISVLGEGYPGILPGNFEDYLFLTTSNAIGKIVEKQ